MTTGKATLELSTGGKWGNITSDKVFADHFYWAGVTRSANPLSRSLHAPEGSIGRSSIPINSPSPKISQSWLRAGLTQGEILPTSLYECWQGNLRTSRPLRSDVKRDNVVILCYPTQKEKRPQVPKPCPWGFYQKSLSSLQVGIKIPPLDGYYRKNRSIQKVLNNI